MYQMTFAGCWNKFRRAELHSETLRDYILTLGKEENLTVLRADLEPHSGYHVFSVASVPDYTQALVDIGILLGDFVHNLRAVLDHMTFQFALYKKDGALDNEEAVQFPIADDTHRFKTASGRNLKEVHPDHVAFIERLQPYHSWHERPYTASGNLHPLALLRNLSNRDKHRIITPTLVLPNTILLKEGLAYAWGSRGGTLVPAIISVSAPQSSTGAPKIGAIFQKARIIGGQPHMDVAAYIQPNIIAPEAGVVFVAPNGLEAFVRGILEEAESLPLPSLP